MQRTIALAILSAGLASLMPAQAQEGVEAVDVVTMTATVEKLDLAARSATLRFDNGQVKTIKIDQSVQNLDQVKVGDKIKAGYAEDIVISIAKGGRAGSAERTAVGLAPKGAKPGGYAVDTVAMTAKIISIDPATQKVTLEDPDGKRSTVKVSKRVQNLDDLKAGDTVNVEITQALLLDVVK